MIAKLYAELAYLFCEKKVTGRFLILCLLDSLILQGRFPWNERKKKIREVLITELRPNGMYVSSSFR